MMCSKENQEEEKLAKLTTIQGKRDWRLSVRKLETVLSRCRDISRWLDLIPELLEKVDDGSMGFTPAVQIAYLKKKEQKDVLDAMELTLCTPSLSQAMRMKS